MVGIGTGFNKKIVTTLLQFLEACYEGLLDKIHEGMDPEDAVKAEFVELKEYIALIQEEMEEIKQTSH